MGLPLGSQACRPRGRKNHSPSEQQERGPSSRNPAGSGGNDSHANGTHGDLGAGGRLRGPQSEESGRAVCPFWLQYEGQVGGERGFGRWTLIHPGTPIGWGESPLWKLWAREVSRLAQGLWFVGTETRIQSLSLRTTPGPHHPQHPLHPHLTPKVFQLLHPRSGPPWAALTFARLP